MTEVNIKNTPITIHTRINENMRISSAYRKYNNEHFEHWYWETLLWENNNIKCDYTSRDINDAVKLHAELFEEYNR